MAPIQNVESIKLAIESEIAVKNAALVYIL